MSPVQDVTPRGGTHRHARAPRVQGSLIFSKMFGMTLPYVYSGQEQDSLIRKGRASPTEQVRGENGGKTIIIVSIIQNMAL